CPAPHRAQSRLHPVHDTIQTTACDHSGLLVWLTGLTDIRYPLHSSGHTRSYVHRLSYPARRGIAQFAREALHFGSHRSRPLFRRVNEAIEIEARLAPLPHLHATGPLARSS